MTVSAPPRARVIGRDELDGDPRFTRRVRRLVVVSSIALGVIFLTAIATTEAGVAATVLLGAGWVLMPLLLGASLAVSRLRYALALPATLVTAGLVALIAGLDQGGTALAGWWTTTAGILFGGGLGGWFWYGVVPVPERLQSPVAPWRWAMIAAHAGLVAVGMALVLGAAVR